MIGTIALVHTTTNGNRTYSGSVPGVYQDHRDASPGSFVHITCDESLPMRRPLSIMRASDDWVEILYKIVGNGLRLLSRKQPGDTVSVLGPLAHRIPPPPVQRIALVPAMTLPGQFKLSRSLRASSRPVFHSTAANTPSTRRALAALAHEA